MCTRAGDFFSPPEEPEGQDEAIQVVYGIVDVVKTYV